MMQRCSTMPAFSRPALSKNDQRNLTSLRSAIFLFGALGLTCGTSCAQADSPTPQATPPAIISSQNDTAPPSIPAGPAPVLPHRVYRLGETMKYHMTGSNRGWQYQLDATDQVEQDTAGTFYEAIHWSNLVSNANMTLSSASLNLQQTLSLSSSGKYLAVPDLGKVQPMLIGPITDLVTFYSDLYLATQYNLTTAGQHAYFAHGKPNSWANGQSIMLGQDAIDFAITLSEVDPEAHTATLRIQHVPPKHSQLHLPAAWMQQPVADAPIHGAPNNWVQIEHSGDAYVAEVGQETFAVEMKVDTNNGKLLFAKMHNPVILVRRTCQEAALTQCDAPVPHSIVRDVTLALTP